MSHLLKQVKGSSSSWVNRLPGRTDKFGWQVGYSAFSVSESRVAAVRRYIQNQEEHHRQVSYREELKWLLTNHGVEFDEADLDD